MCGVETHSVTVCVWCRDALSDGVTQSAADPTAAPRSGAEERLDWCRRRRGSVSFDPGDNGRQCRLSGASGADSADDFEDCRTGVWRVSDCLTAAAQECG